MPAETSATAVVAVALFLLAVLALPFLLLAAAPFLVARLALARPAPVYRRAIAR